MNRARHMVTTQICTTRLRVARLEVYLLYQAARTGDGSEARARARARARAPAGGGWAPGAGAGTTSRAAARQAAARARRQPRTSLARFLMVLTPCSRPEGAVSFRPGS